MSDSKSGVIGAPLKVVLAGPDKVNSNAMRDTTKTEYDALQDSMAVMLKSLSAEARPLNLTALLSALTASAPDMVFTHYLIGDGGNILYGQSSISDQRDSVPRALRWVVVGTEPDKPNDPSILIVNGFDIHSDTTFLQTVAWDDTSRAFNFYARQSVLESADGKAHWFWNGNSWHALHPDTRRKFGGPFCGHVSGGLQMKELKAPWTHWNSNAQSIVPEVLPPNSPMHDTGRDADWWHAMGSAEDLEKIVRNGIFRWVKARVSTLVTAAFAHENKQMKGVREIMEQVLTTQTVNLVSSVTLSTSADPKQMPQPFWLQTTNGTGMTNGLQGMLNLPGFKPTITVPALTLPAQAYKESLAKFDFKLKAVDPDTKQVLYEQSGDSPFAFLVPEAAFEDLALHTVITFAPTAIVSRDFMAALLLVDFPNPIFSGPRSALMDLVPSTTTLTFAQDSKNTNIKVSGSDLEKQFTANAESAAKKADGSVLAAAAKEFLRFRNLLSEPAGAGRKQCVAEVMAYLNAVAKRLDSKQSDEKTIQAAVEEYMRLGESRRWQIQGNPLFQEFDLTLPKTNLDFSSKFLRMTATGTVEEDPVGLQLPPPDMSAFSQSTSPAAAAAVGPPNVDTKLSPSEPRPPPAAAAPSIVRVQCPAKSGASGMVKCPFGRNSSRAERKAQSTIDAEANSKSGVAVAPPKTQSATDSKSAGRHGGSGGSTSGGSGSTAAPASASAFVIRAVDKAHHDKSLGQILELPPSALSGLSKNADVLLARYMGIRTVKDLANSEFVQIARALITLAERE